MSAFDGLELELLQSSRRMSINSIYANGLEFMHAIAAKEKGSWHVYRGSSEENAVRDLPWLDLDLARIIAIGADDGDATWVALDYRSSTRSPRVVFNVIRERGRFCEWREAAATTEQFIGLIGKAEVRKWQE